MGFVLPWLLVIIGSAWPVWGWKECLISPEDEWKEATERTPAIRMREEYERTYTCRTNDTEASFMAANYYFDSPCLAKRFYPQDVQSCLKGRRIIFLGDSLSNQQGDSLVGMLGWTPEWLPRDGPRNHKQAYDEDGNLYFTLVDCWHPPEGSTIQGVQRCFDVYSRNFPSADQPVQTLGEEDKPHIEVSAVPAEAPHDRRALRWGKEKIREQSNERGLRADDAKKEDEEDQEISVHVRMTVKPIPQPWFETAIRDYNETRPSDVFVVNFGAHYHGTPEDEYLFKRDIGPLLDSMAEVGKTATVVWREMSPVHFPSTNGTYEAFLELDLGNTACCTGTPPKRLDRNVWVEDYLRDNGLEDRVKILRIYDLSYARGAAHHTCYRAPPSTMDQTGAISDYCHGSYATDCTHWSETGVVEEWNELLLNHICH